MPLRVALPKDFPSRVNGVCSEFLYDCMSAKTSADPKKFQELESMFEIMYSAKTLKDLHEAMAEFEPMIRGERLKRWRACEIITF